VKEVIITVVSATVVEAVGWNANWSLKTKLGDGGRRSDGYIYIVFDNNTFQDSADDCVTDIGL